MVNFEGHSEHSPSHSLSHSHYQTLEPEFWTRTSFIQIVYGMIAAQSGFGVGLSFAFTALMIPELKEITKELTLIQEAFLDSTITLLAPFGCISGGFLQDKFGRRLILCIGYAPIALGWLCTGLADSIMLISLGRAITGFGNGMALTSCRTYITEITLPKMRGVVGTFPDFALALGVTTQSILGAIMTWRLICYICAGHAFILFVVHVFIPESPYYLLEISTERHALECLEQLRAKDHNIKLEMELIIKCTRACGILRLSYKQKIALLKSQDARRPLVILGIYFILGQFSGLTILIFSSLNIIEGILVSINEYYANMLIGISKLVGTVTLATLIFKISRKALAMYSAGGVCMFSLILGVYLQYHTSATFIPVALLMVYTFFASLGYYTLPVLMAFEIIPMQIRGSVGGICMAFYFWAIFVANWLYPFMRAGLGLDYLYMMFGGFAFTTIFYLFLFLPETKNASLSEIECDLKTRMRMATTRVNFSSDPRIIFLPPSAHRESRSAMSILQDSSTSSMEDIPTANFNATGSLEDIPAGSFGKVPAGSSNEDVSSDSSEDIPADSNKKRPSDSMTDLRDQKNNI